MNLMLKSLGLVMVAAAEIGRQSNRANMIQDVN